MGTKVSKEKVDSHLQIWKNYDEGRLGLPYGVAVASDRTVYVSDCKNHRIQRFRQDGTFVSEWGREGKEKGEFIRPYGLAITEYEGCLVRDALYQIAILANFPPGLLPICAAYIGDDCLLVVDSGNHRVQVFGMDGRFLRKWGRQGIGDGYLCNPSGCSVSRHTGIVYVADFGNDRVQTFDLDGTFLTCWIVPEVPFKQARCANRMYSSVVASYKPPQAKDSEWLYVSGPQNLYNVRWKITPPYSRPETADGSEDVHKWQPSTLPVYPSCETIVMVDNEDGREEVYVGVAGVDDMKSGFILRCRPNGDLICKYDLFTYSWPVAICKSPDNMLYISDANRARIIVLTL